MKNLKRNFSLMLCLIFCFTFLTGCGSSKLSDDFDQDEIEKLAKDVISYINNKDSESILEMTTVEMGKALTPDVLEEIYAAIGEGGEFVEIQDISVGGQKDKSSEEEFAIAVAKTKYQHKNFIYTITFSKQMKLAGLYYK